jgi:putative membrane protein
MYVGLMLIAPIINLAFKNMNESTRKYAIANIILTISIPVTLADLFSNVRYSILAHILPNWWYYTWPLMYYIIGVIYSYNKNILKDSFSNSKILFWITLIVSTVFYSLLNIHWESTLHVNIFIVIITTCIFSWLLNLDINVNSKLRTAIIFVSNNTLLAYLLSYIVDNITYPFVNQITNMNMRFSMFPVS